MEKKISLNISLFLFIAITSMVVIQPVLFADAFFLDLWISFFWAAGIGLASGLDGWKGKSLTFLFALLPVAAGAIYYGVSFSSEESFLIAGVIPWSDAYMHFKQAAQMAVEGMTQTGMNGRFLYPAYFSSLLTMTGCHLLWAHALSGVFFATATVMALRAITAIFKAPAAMISAFVYWLFYRTHCSGLVMTENLGILCGLVSLSLFLIATQRRNLLFLLAGFFMLSLGLCARPGALVVLPMMVLFIGMAGWFGWNGLPERFSRIWKSVTAAFLALLMISASFGSNSLLSRTLYQGNVITNGNFSFTLYGMLTGGKWSDAATQWHWNSPLAMKESLKLLEKKPQLLLIGAARAYKEALRRRILFMFNHESRPATILSLLALAGIIALWKIKALRPYAEWMTLITLGIILSLPFAPPWDAAERPFAATIPFQGLFAGIGFVALLQLVFVKIMKLPPDDEISTKLSATHALLFSLFIFVLSVPLPLAHQFSVMHQQRRPEQAGIQLYAGSIVTVTPQNKDSIRHRMLPFLGHNPEQRFLDALLAETSSLAIDWKNKNFERLLVLPGATEKNLMNINGWKVDARLLPATSPQN